MFEGFASKIGYLIFLLVFIWEQKPMNMLYTFSIMHKCILRFFQVVLLRITQ